MNTLHDQFKQQAVLNPNAIAVADDSSEISYRELDKRSDAMAASLNLAGVGLDDTVGVYLPKSVDYIVACVAAMKAGGAFLPLFLDSPPSQLGKILEQTGSKAVVTTETLKKSLPSTSEVRLITTDDWNPPSQPWPASPEASLENLMFVVYTSGTTGEPKGIQLPHRAAAHSYAERYKVSGYKPGQRVACNIFFVWEVFRVLSRGATVFPIPDDVIYDPKLLLDFLIQNRITEMLFTPSLLETMLNHWPETAWTEQLSELEVVWLNGEVVTEELRQKALRHLSGDTRLLNTYSISECHDVASYDLREVKSSTTGFSAVGYPIDGISVKLMNSSGIPVARTDTGEVYVGGPGLARGYLGKPHLTAERFVHIDNVRYYRTGDIGFIRENGLLEIRGRCDSMVKIRGYSVHLGAVQTALERLPSVSSAAVVAVGKEGRDKRLVAYVVGAEDKSWTVDSCTASCPELREALRESLPEFMLPNLFLEVENLPLSPSTGKLDTKLLPQPPERKTFQVDDLSLPSNPSLVQTESLVAKLWERILGLDPGVVEPESNFFDLGGHSLMAVRVVNHLERITGSVVSVKELYKHSSVKQLSQFLHTGESQAPHELSGPSEKDWHWQERVPNKTAWTTPELAKGVLVTGATGFLGSFLVDQLADATSCPIFCLVRGQQPQGRLEENFESYGLSFNPRVRAVGGDLSQKNLGLSPDDRLLLEQKVDIVFHCGAAVNYVHNYDVLKPHTVDGTREIINFCCAGEKAKTLHYISTNGVFPGGGKYLENKKIDPYLADLSNGYGHSKWVAEKLVWQASDAGLPTTLYRPGNIGHHSRTGARNPNDFQTLIVRACTETGYVPQVEDWYFEMTPVDFLVDAIVGIAQEPNHEGKVYNVVQRPTNPAGIFFSELGLPAVAKSEWVERLSRWAKSQNDSQLEVLARSLNDVEGYLQDTSIYDGEQFNKAITELQLPRPDAGLAYLQLLSREPKHTSVEC